MQVILAKTAGFCYGVERAVRMAEAAAREGGCVMLGSIIHNDRVITALEALGARQADSPQQVRPRETVIIRAHGETREALRVLEERGAQIMDATCPHVLRIHRLVERAARAGRTPIIVGEAHHPEVMPPQAAVSAAWCWKTRQSWLIGWRQTRRGRTWICWLPHRRPVFVRYGKSV